MCVSGVRVCEPVWAGTLVQGTKTKGLFCPRSPPGQLVTGAARELRARERESEAKEELVCDRERDNQHGRRKKKHRERILQNKNALTPVRRLYKMNESLLVTLSCRPSAQNKPG